MMLFLNVLADDVAGVDEEEFVVDLGEWVEWVVHCAGGDLDWVDRGSDED